MEHGAFLFAGEERMLEPLSLWGEVWLFQAVGGDEAWEGGFVVWERGGGVERGGGIGRGSYGHWLVRVPPELVLEVGEVRVPPLPMKEVGLPSLPPDPTWEVWVMAQQASPFLSSLTT